MKLLLLIAPAGYSFVNQAQALSKGLKKIGVNHEVVKINDGLKLEEVLLKYQPDFVVGIGAWLSYHYFVELPLSLGYKVLPWIVSDDKIDQYINEYNKLDLILTPSHHCKDVFTRDGIKPEIIQVLPEAVDPAIWHPMKEKDLAAFLKLISISDDNITLPFKYDLYSLHQQRVPILFTTGGDATSKGAQEVITSLGLLKNKLADHPWLYLIKTWPAAGSLGRSIEELRLAERYGVEKNIRYVIGEFSQQFLLGLMNACDIYVAPSRGEGFGLPLVEAQMCQKPVITTEGTSTKEIILKGETGFLAKADYHGQTSHANTKDLAQYLERLLFDKNLRVEMGKKARPFATSQFSPEAIARKFVQIITQTYGKSFNRGSLLTPLKVLLNQRIYKQSVHQPPHNK